MHVDVRCRIWVTASYHKRRSAPSTDAAATHRCSAATCACKWTSRQWTRTTVARATRRPSVITHSRWCTVWRSPYCRVRFSIFTSTVAGLCDRVHLTVRYHFPFSLPLWRGYAIVAVCLSFYLNVSRITAELIVRFHRNLVIGPTNQSEELIDFQRWSGPGYRFWSTFPLPSLLRNSGYYEIY